MMGNPAAIASILTRQFGTLPANFTGLTKDQQSDLDERFDIALKDAVIYTGAIEYLEKRPVLVNNSTGSEATRDPGRSNSDLN